MVVWCRGGSKLYNLGYLCVYCVYNSNMFTHTHTHPAHRALSNTLAPGDTCICLDYTQDSALRQHSHTPLDFLKLESEEELWVLYCKGREYAQLLMKQGHHLGAAADVG